MKEELESKTLEELIDMLPTTSLIPKEYPQKHFSTKKWWRTSVLNIQKHQQGQWEVQYLNPQTGVKMKGKVAKKLRDAVVQTLEYLKENSLI